MYPQVPHRICFVLIQPLSLTKGCSASRRSPRHRRRRRATLNGPRLLTYLQASEPRTIPYILIIAYSDYLPGRRSTRDRSCERSRTSTCTSPPAVASSAHGSHFLYRFQAPGARRRAGSARTRELGTTPTGTRARGRSRPLSSRTWPCPKSSVRHCYHRAFKIHLPFTLTSQPVPSRPRPPGALPRRRPKCRRFGDLVSVVCLSHKIPFLTQ